MPAFFVERAGCASCHPAPLYTDNRLHKTVVPPGVGPPDPAAQFKTPTLRAIAQTAPYFHGGTEVQLEAAIDVELTRGKAELTTDERRDLIDFVSAL